MNEYYPCPLRKSNKYMADFIEIYENQVDSDCSFALQDGRKQKIIKCHKLILRASSPVFKAMFYGSMAPTTNAPVVIKDYSYNIFEKFIKIFYGFETIVADGGEAFELYSISHKYMFETGMKIAIDYMKLGVASGTNLEKIFKFGIEYNDEAIIKLCFDHKRTFLNQTIKHCVKNDWKNTEFIHQYDTRKFYSSKFDEVIHEGYLKAYIQKECAEIKKNTEIKDYIKDTLSLAKFLHDQETKVLECLFKNHETPSSCIYCNADKETAHDDSEPVMIMISKKRKHDDDS